MTFSSKKSISYAAVVAPFKKFFRSTTIHRYTCKGGFDGGHHQDAMGTIYFSYCSVWRSCNAEKVLLFTRRNPNCISVVFEVNIDSWRSSFLFDISRILSLYDIQSPGVGNNIDTNKFSILIVRVIPNVHQKFPWDLTYAQSGCPKMAKYHDVDAIFREFIHVHVIAFELGGP